MSSSTLPHVDPPVSTALFEEQVQAVKDWWASPRYKGIKRPYSAEDVVSKRGALQQSYPSSLMARKLFNLLEERAAKGEPVHTSAFILAHIDSTMADHMFPNPSGCN
jgi:isocitrate lyase